MTTILVVPPHHYQQRMQQSAFLEGPLRSVAFSNHLEHVSHLAKVAEGKRRSDILVLVSCPDACLQLFILLCAASRELL